jgi:hypothetical protein
MPGAAQEPWQQIERARAAAAEQWLALAIVED